MNRKTKAAIVLLSLLCLSSLGYAQTQKLVLRLHAGLVSPLEESIEASVETGFGIEMSLQKNISISFDYGYWKSSIKEALDGLYDGNLTVTPFLITVTYSFFKNQSFSPYIRLGAGIILSSLFLKLR
jgi:hypothetical protein